MRKLIQNLYAENPPPDLPTCFSECGDRCHVVILRSLPKGLFASSSSSSSYSTLLSVVSSVPNLITYG